MLPLLSFEIEYPGSPEGASHPLPSHVLFQPKVGLVGICIGWKDSVENKGHRAVGVDAEAFSHLFLLDEKQFVKLVAHSRSDGSIWVDVFASSKVILWDDHSNHVHRAVPRNQSTFDSWLALLRLCGFLPHRLLPLHNRASAVPAAVLFRATKDKLHAQAAMEQSGGLRSEMRTYQKRALSWMLDMEAGGSW